jgi:hypothetical protein
MVFRRSGLRQRLRRDRLSRRVYKTRLYEKLAAVSARLQVHLKLEPVVRSFLEERACLKQIVEADLQVRLHIEWRW